MSKTVKKTATKKAKSTLSLNQKKDWARTLYLQNDLSQKEIAIKVDVSEQTLSKWVNDNGREWDKMRKTLLMSKSAILRRLYDILDKVTIEIQESEDTDAKKADQIVKLTAAIKNIETETSVAVIMEVARMFINWLQNLDMQYALSVANHFDSYIKERLKRF